MALSVSIWVWVAVALALGGVVGSVVPGIPGASLSLAGIVVYWWSSGFADPSLPVFVVLVVVALLAAVVDVAGSAIAVRAGGASTTTAVVALLAGLVLGLLTGPVGFVVGVAAAAFAVEFYRTRDETASGRAALFATVGVLGSVVVQGLLTLSLLVALVVVILV